MDDRTLTVLEFDRVLAAAGSLCQTPLGRSSALALRPLPDPESVGLELDRVAEMSLLVEIEGGLDLSGLHDLSGFENRAQHPRRISGPRGVGALRTDPPVFGPDSQEDTAPRPRSIRFWPGWARSWRTTGS